MNILIHSLIYGDYIYLFIVGYLVIGAGFVGIYGKNKGSSVYLVTLFLTGLGIIGRYFFEYGETSNIRDFTKFNIISFLVVVPIYTVLAYVYISRKHIE